MGNAVFSSFGIDLQGEVAPTTKSQGGKDFQYAVQAVNFERYGLVVSTCLVSNVCELAH